MKRFIASFSGVIIFTLSAIYIHNVFFLNDYKATQSSKKVEILIADGDTGTQIARKLFEAGVIKAEKVFYKLAINQKRSQSIAPGVHEIDLNISAAAALDQILDPARNRGLFGFSEGLRKSEVFELMNKSKMFTGKLTNKIMPSKKYMTQNLEGFLFPAQYSFTPNTSFDEAIEVMLDRFEQASVSSKINQGYLKYTPYDLLIMASMIQAEGDTEDFSKISRVIYNRLKIGMPLQINATIDYATNTRGKIRLPYKRLEITSKYNTYKFRGLPPTPIGNPGEAAMAATVMPEKGDWLYYVTVKPSDTRFTADFDQFNKWANEFRKNEEAGLFK